MRITAVDALTMPTQCNYLGRSCHFHPTVVNQNATMHKNLTQGMYNISALWGVKPNLAHAIITQTCWYLSKEYSHTFIIAILVILQSTKFTKSVQLINAKARLVQCSYTKEPKNVLFVTYLDISVHSAAGLNIWHQQGDCWVDRYLLPAHDKETYKLQHAVSTHCLHLVLYNLLSKGRNNNRHLIRVPNWLC